MPALLDDGPPPSTYAAQIVQNLETAKARPSLSGSKFQLKDLFKKVLDLDYHGLINDDTFERDIGINHKLIWTIVKGCLLLHGNTNPFDNQNDVVEQANGGLAVIEVTIRRTPDVLFVVPAGDTSYARNEGPLFLGLVPHLLTLLHLDNGQIVRDGTIKVLQTMLSLQGKPSMSKFRKRPISKYIQGCVDDLLAYLLQFEAQAIGSRIFTLPVVPSIDTAVAAYSHDFPIINCKIEANNAAQALSIALCSLELIDQGSITKSRRPDLATLRWAIDSLTLCESLVSAATQEQDNTAESLFVSIIRTLNQVLEQISLSTQSRNELDIASRLLCRSVASSIEMHLKFGGRAPSLDQQEAMCMSLLLLSSLATKQDIVWVAYDTHLAQTIYRLLENMVIVQAFEADAQVIFDIAPEVISGSLEAFPADRLSALNPVFQQTYNRLSSSTRPQVAPDSHVTERLRFMATLDGSAAVIDFRVAYMTAIEREVDENIDLAELISTTLAELDEETQIRLIDILGREACSLSESLVGGECTKCDSQTVRSDSAFLSSEESTLLSEILVCVIRMSQQQKMTRPRVHAMLALRRYFAHCNDAEHMSTQISTLPPWPLKSLRSSIRSLRIAAVSTMGYLIANDLPRTILKTNRAEVFKTLRLMEDKGLIFQETSVMAHGHIASIVNHEESIETCLFRLINSLGHGNPFIANLAFEELQRLCGHNPHSAMRLFEPYWRSLAPAIVTNLQAKPQICHSVCNLLGMNVLNFLKLTQYHTLPLLIVRKQNDILQQIAEANGPDTNLARICSSEEQLPAILAQILLQPTEDIDSTIVAYLSLVHQDLADDDPVGLLRMEPVRLAAELLQIAGSNDANEKLRARWGLDLLAERYNQRKPNKKHTAIQMFFEEMSLGIVPLLSDIIGQTKTAQPMGVRRQCIVAIQEMAEMAGDYSLKALPQITSCLHMAIEDPEFCDEALCAWLTLMTVVDLKEDFEPLLLTSFALIAKHWHFFSTDMQQAAHRFILDKVEHRKEWIQDNVLSIPSLAGIPLFAKLESELEAVKAQFDWMFVLEAFGIRCQSDHANVITQALIELPSYLIKVQGFIHNSVSSVQPDPAIGFLVKTLLDVCTRFVDSKPELAADAARCLGLIGCLDPAKIELPSEERGMLFVLSDFAASEETVDFVVYFLEEVLVKAFLAETDTRQQGLLAYAIQELLKLCGFETKNTIDKSVDTNDHYRRWIGISEKARETLAPLLSSKYTLGPMNPTQPCAFPIHSEGMGHAVWLRQLVFDLAGRPKGTNAGAIFSIIRRIVRRQNLSISAFLLPYITLNIVFQGSDIEISQIWEEFLKILSTPLPIQQAASDSLIACSQDVFRTLDYMTRWLQGRRRTKAYWPRVGVADAAEAQAQDAERLENIENFLKAIPAETVTDRAVECKSYTRALLHWESHIREISDLPVERALSRNDMDSAFMKLQQIYNSIDEPDGIEGIASRIVTTTFEQQMLEHRKAGRWSTLQSWYEVELNKAPKHPALQVGFLQSLKEIGQHDMLINEFANLKINDESREPLTELLTEAAWTSNRWDILKQVLGDLPSDADTKIMTGLGRVMLKLLDRQEPEARLIVDKLRADAIRNLSTHNTGSLQSCHDVMFQLQLLSEVEQLGLLDQSNRRDANNDFLKALPRRVDSLGTFASEQQTLLATQRAMLQIAQPEANPGYVSNSWLASAKLARKSGFDHQAFHAIYQACNLNNMSYVIEETRLLWTEGHHIKAIHNLKAAIEAGAFGQSSAKEAIEARRKNQAAAKLPQNPLAARAHLLLAKWIDNAGQSQSDAIIEQYRVAVDLHSRSEKGHYHLGRHYNKLLESEKAKPPVKQATNLITGELAKLVLENYLRSISMGAKHIHETIPRVLTLWLELGSDVKKKIDAKYGSDVNFQQHTEKQRALVFKAASTSMKKYIDRLPAYMFYTALPQVVARICHEHEMISASLVEIVSKVVVAHSQQAMWSLLALIKSKKQEKRLQKGQECWKKVLDTAKKLNNDGQSSGIVELMKQGQRLSEQLLSVSNKDLGKRYGIVSLANDLSFSHSKSSHCRLAIPVEAMLTASLPIAQDVRSFKHAFPKDTITIGTFLDEVLVLNSLIKPKKVSIRGSDGRVYGILCKPKDDLRKDQRLLEFNSMITKLLKRDPQSSKRRLYIKTYAVTPLNEECGLIEWVEGVKPLRDILLDIYRIRNVKPDYNAIKEVLDQITADRNEIGRFKTEVLKDFPPVFHEWFTSMFPSPSAWFDARLRYTRSCAVMSMVGHVLGLGDRHGENILFQGENGGTFHVDFNCLFDKGLTFEKPERVPFRLTHNMVDAFGVYGYEGPFRKCCELTMGILRQHEHALMTILETFVYDPTTDFIGKKRKANPIVPDTPEGVLEAVRTKVRGLISGESVPLSVEGHVQLLIQEAVDAFNLSSMYIGWCAFL